MVNRGANGKQVITQRIREAERDNVFSEYVDRKGEIITGIVRRFERGNIIVDLGRTEAILPIRERYHARVIAVSEFRRMFSMFRRMLVTSVVCLVPLRPSH